MAGVLGPPNPTTNATHLDPHGRLSLGLRDSRGAQRRLEGSVPRGEQGLWRNSPPAHGLCVRLPEGTGRQARAQVQEAFPNMLPGEAGIGNGFRLRNGGLRTGRAWKSGAGSAPTSSWAHKETECLPKA